MQYSEQIQRGVSFLNEKCPGWLQYVDLDKLDMMYGMSCVLGQVGVGIGVGTYTFGACPHFKLSAQQCIDLGFTVDEEEDHEYEDFRELTRSWKETIQALQH